MSPAATRKKTPSSKDSSSTRGSTKFPIERLEELTRVDRAEILDPQSVFPLLPMRVYQHIADIGCGPGYFSIPLAKYAFDGKIYAVDIQQGMLDALGKRVEETRLSNVNLLLSKESKIPIDDATLDGAILVNSLHEASKPVDLLKETRRSLQKGGWAAIIDWRKEKMEIGPPLAARLERDKAVKAAESAGFRVQSVHDLNQWEYIVLLAA